MPTALAAPVGGAVDMLARISMSFALPRAASHRAPHWPGLPNPRRTLAGVALVLAAAIGSTAVATIAYLRTPAPTGGYSVGRSQALLVDPARAEPAERGGGPRRVGVIAWYPAEGGSGQQAPYVPDLDRISAGLEASGELSAPVVAGLRLAGTSARTGAAVARGDTAYPVALLSPGNATNVAFYGSLAEDLASRGFVVIGVDHPYQVAAVYVGDGVAVYREIAGDPADAVAARIDERVLDLTFVLDQLATGNGIPPELAGRLDLGRVAAIGHSNGGIAAASMCADRRVDACVNIDGLSIGGPFSAEAQPAHPAKPFLFLTKETTIHPALVELFEQGGADTYRVVVPAATHGGFADGERFVPRLLPLDSTVDHVLAVEREVVGAFLERYLAGGAGPVFDDLSAPTDLYIEVYPLGEQPNLP